MLSSRLRITARRLFANNSTLSSSSRTPHGGDEHRLALLGRARRRYGDSSLSSSYATLALLVVGVSAASAHHHRPLDGGDEAERAALCVDRDHRTFATRGTLTDLKAHYLLKGRIGEGTFAIVHKGYDRDTNEEVAVKEIDKSKTDDETLANETDIMQRMGHHPNLISLRNVYESPSSLYLIQDLADGGELFDRIVQKGELSERQAAKFFRDACLGLQHLHERQICHLDIKPENLLLRTIRDPKTGEVVDERVALADFGLALYVGGSQTHEMDLSVGTPAYWAAEMIRREKFSLGVDVWAMGCVLYILLCGCHPFDPTGDAPDAQILNQVVNGTYDKSSPEYRRLSSSAKDLLFHMLQKEPHDRYTIQQVLHHPWVMELDSLPTASVGRDHLDRLRGYRVLTLIKSGMVELLGKAEADLFGALDTDGDGYLSRDEVKRALEILGFNFQSKDADAELDAFLRLADTNEDGRISREEFEAVIATRFDDDAAPPQRARLEDLAGLFRAFDRDGDGYVQGEDVYHVLVLLGGTTSNSLQRLEVEKMDLDGDGRVSFSEFVAYVRETEAANINRRGVMTSSLNKLRDRTDMLKSRREAGSGGD